MTVVTHETEITFSAGGIVHLGEQEHVDRSKARYLIRRAEERGELVRLCDGTWVDAQRWPLASDYEESLRPRVEIARARIQALAIAQRNPDRVLTGRGAALVHGLPLLDAPRQITLSATERRAPRTRIMLDDLVVSYDSQRLPEDEITLIDGARVTSLARTVFDVARTLPAVDDTTRRDPDTFRRFAEAIALADGALRGRSGTLGIAGREACETLLWPDAERRFEPPDWGLDSSYPLLAPPRYSPISSADLVPFLRGCGAGSDLPIGSRAATVLLAASPWSENAFESAVKTLLIELGIRFIQQVRIVDENGRHVMRVDFLLPDYGIIISCDGRIKYDPPGDCDSGWGDAGSRPNTADIWHDRRQDYALVNLGYVVLHLLWFEVFNGEAAKKIRAATTRAREAIEAGRSIEVTPRGRWMHPTTALPSAAYSHFRKNS